MNVFPIIRLHLLYSILLPDNIQALAFADILQLASAIRCAPIFDIATFVDAINLPILVLALTALRVPVLQLFVILLLQLNQYVLHTPHPTLILTVQLSNYIINANTPTTLILLLIYTSIVSIPYPLIVVYANVLIKIWLLTLLELVMAQVFSCIDCTFILTVIFDQIMAHAVSAILVLSVLCLTFSTHILHVPIILTLTFLMNKEAWLSMIFQVWLDMHVDIHVHIHIKILCIVELIIDIFGWVGGSVVIVLLVVPWAYVWVAGSLHH